jgi:hypothetical protein
VALFAYHCLGLFSYSQADDMSSLWDAGAGRQDEREGMSRIKWYLMSWFETEGVEFDIGVILLAIAIAIIVLTRGKA